MKKYIIHIITVAILLLMILINGCSSTITKKKYKFTNTKNLQYEDLTVSPDPLDNYEAYQFFFRLKKKADSIKIEINSKSVGEKLVLNEKMPAVYFIMERTIDISGFKKGGNKYAFSIVTKNYNAKWKPRNNLTIFASKTNPMKALDEKSIYRIKFTTFSYGKYSYTIKIHSDCEVEYSNVPIEVKN